MTPVLKANQITGKPTPLEWARLKVVVMVLIRLSKKSAQCEVKVGMFNFLFLFSIAGIRYSVLDMDEPFCHLGVLDFLCLFLLLLGRHHLVSMLRLHRSPAQGGPFANSSEES